MATSADALLMLVLSFHSLGRRILPSDIAAAMRDEMQVVARD